MQIGLGFNKADIRDQRETPALPLATKLCEMGAEVRYFDPYVDNFVVEGREIGREVDLAAALHWSDLAVLVQAHTEIVDSESISVARRVLDTRGVLTGDNVERL